jgi:DNA-binding NarL/FixJ family response regulator
LLERHALYQVVGEAANGEEAITKALASKPDVILLDHSLPVVSGLEVACQVRKWLPRTKILFLTMHDSEMLVQAALKAGAAGYLHKSDATSDLISAIAAVTANKPFYTSKVCPLRDQFPKEPVEPSPQLTIQERRVMVLMAEGCKSKEIARILSISPKTVDAHRTAIMRKLHVSSFAGIVRYAVRNMLVAA